MVINYSAGGDSASEELRTACRYVQSHGMLICVAAGDSDGMLKFPAAFAGAIPSVISVGGIGENDEFFGPLNAEIFAPAIFVRSTKPEGFGSGGVYARVSGTSIATPFVTGVAALIWSRQPMLTAAQVKQRMLEHARNVGGRRVLDAAAALEA